MDVDTKDVQDTLSLVPYKTASYLRLSPSFAPLTKNHYSLFSISHVFGWAIVVTASNDQEPAFVLARLDDLQAALDEAEPHETTLFKADQPRSIVVPTTSFCSDPSAFITHVAFAAWDRLIVIATSDGSIHIFSFFHLVNRMVTSPPKLIPPLPAGTALRMLVPNPSKGGPLSSVIALIYEDGTIKVVDCYEIEKTYWTSRLATAAEWSPMGKRLLVGYSDGRLEFATHDGISKGTIDPPGLVKEECLSVLQLKWLDQKNYIVTFTQSADQFDGLNETFCLHVPRQSELSSSSFSRVLDVLVSDGDPSLPPDLFTTSLSVNPQASWRHFVISSFTHGTSLTLIGYDSSDKPFSLNLGEDRLPVLPASEEDFSPAAPLGFACSYCPRQQIPLIWCFTSDGVLAVWKVQFTTPLVSATAEVWAGISETDDILTTSEKGIEGPPTSSTAAPSCHSVTQRGLATSQSTDSSIKPVPFSQVSAFGPPSSSDNRAPSGSVTAFGQPTSFGNTVKIGPSGPPSTSGFGKSSFGSFSGGLGGFGQFANQATSGFGSSSSTSSAGFAAFANSSHSTTATSSGGFAQFTTATSQPSFLDGSAATAGASIFDSQPGDEKKIVKVESIDTTHHNPFLESSATSSASSFATKKAPSASFALKDGQTPNASFKATSKVSAFQSRVTRDVEEDEEPKKSQSCDSGANSPASSTSDVEQALPSMAALDSKFGQSSSRSVIEANAPEDLFNQKMTLKPTQPDIKDGRSPEAIASSSPRPSSVASSLSVPFGFGGKKLPHPSRASFLSSSVAAFQNPMPGKPTLVSAPSSAATIPDSSPPLNQGQIAPSKEPGPSGSSTIAAEKLPSDGSSVKKLEAVKTPSSGPQGPAPLESEAPALAPLASAGDESTTKDLSPIPGKADTPKALVHESITTSQPTSASPTPVPGSSVGEEGVRTFSPQSRANLSLQSDKPISDLTGQSAEADTQSVDTSKKESGFEELIQSGSDEDTSSESENPCSESDDAFSNNDDERSEVESNDVSESESDDQLAAQGGSDAAPNENLKSAKATGSYLPKDHELQNAFQEVIATRAQAQPREGPPPPASAKLLFGFPSSPRPQLKRTESSSGKTQSQPVGSSPIVLPAGGPMDSAVGPLRPEKDSLGLPTSVHQPTRLEKAEPLPTSVSRNNLTGATTSATSQTTSQTQSSHPILTPNQPQNIPIHHAQVSPFSMTPSHPPTPPPPFFTKPDFSTPMKSLSSATVPKICVNPNSEVLHLPSGNPINQALTQISDSITSEISCLASVSLVCRRYLQECYRKSPTGPPDLEHLASQNWLFGDFAAFYQYIKYLIECAQRRESETETRFQAVTALDNVMIKTDMKLDEIKRILRLRNDPEFSQVVRSRQLGPIQLAHQKDIRRLIRDVEHGISQMSEVLQSLESRRREADKCKNRIQAPVLDRINRCIRYITLGSTQHIVDIEKLHLRVCRHRALISSLKDKAQVDTLGSGLNCQISSQTTPDQAAAVRALLSEHKGAMLKESILKNSTGPILTRAQTFDQQKPSAEPSGLSQIGLNGTLLIKPRHRANPRSMISSKGSIKFDF